MLTIKPRQFDLTDEQYIMVKKYVDKIIGYVSVVRFCPYCGKQYEVPKNNNRKVHCGDGKCRQKYEVERHGGIVAYREWERTRKIKPSGRKPGRPKKENNHADNKTNSR